jgi:hypothetical protein
MDGGNRLHHRKEVIAVPKQKRTKLRKRHISVDIRQSSSARSGQGGNPISINASDVGVVRTDIKQ